ncbi:MAG: hypothetical protein QGG36_09185 [Pirellulaceae bacterium]|jgi:hypothetical protein|nr:hypothetical protein [Pirellulaceae bacterium]MDP7015960.1 hypothetical protein [Pirellulaceae bacterium]
MVSIEQVLQVLSTGDILHAAEMIEDGQPKEVAERYSELVKRLYEADRPLSAMTAAAYLAVHYCLQKGGVRGDGADLRDAAKRIAYNASANLWPGWRDPGVEPAKSDIAAGRDLARLNLRLAEELERDDVVFGNAHWLLGAHHLALAERDEARDQFDESARRFEAGGKDAFVEMARGYRAIALMADQGRRAEGQLQLDASVNALQQMPDDEDAAFFVQQLQTAREFFAS